MCMKYKLQKYILYFPQYTHIQKAYHTKYTVHNICLKKQRRRTQDEKGNQPEGYNKVKQDLPVPVTGIHFLWFNMTNAPKEGRSFLRNTAIFTMRHYPARLLLLYIHEKVVKVKYNTIRLFTQPTEEQLYAVKHFPQSSIVIYTGRFDVK